METQTKTDFASCLLNFNVSLYHTHIYVTGTSIIKHFMSPILVQCNGKIQKFIQKYDIFQNIGKNNTSGKIGTFYLAM